MSTISSIQTVGAPPIRVSVVVPTWRRPDLLMRCLRALQCQSLSPGEYEIIVCDDGPDAQTRELVRRIQTSENDNPAIHYLPVTGTQGPAAARNRGWEYAHAPVIAFTDDDTMAHPDWLQMGLDAMVEGVDAVAGRIEMPLPDSMTDLQRDAAGLMHSEFVTANCFVRRAVLQDVGGFDERFSMAWREDSDLHFRLLKGGYKVVRAPQALVVHPLREMTFAAGLGMQKKILFDVLLYRKHPRFYRQRIRTGPPWFYLLVTGLLVLALMLPLFGRFDAARLAWLAWGLATLVFFLKRLRGSAWTPRNIAELALTSVAIPPLSIFWRLVGAVRFGARLP